jgi:hypothetical protein
MEEIMAAEWPKADSPGRPASGDAVLARGTECIRLFFAKTPPHRLSGLARLLEQLGSEDDEQRKMIWKRGIALFSPDLIKFTTVAARISSAGIKAGLFSYPLPLLSRKLFYLGMMIQHHEMQEISYGKAIRCRPDARSVPG